MKWLNHFLCLLLITICGKRSVYSVCTYLVKIHRHVDISVCVSFTSLVLREWCDYDDDFPTTSDVTLKYMGKPFSTKPNQIKPGTVCIFRGLYYMHQICKPCDFSSFSAPSLLLLLLPMIITWVTWKKGTLAGLSIKVNAPVWYSHNTWQSTANDL